MQPSGSDPVLAAERSRLEDTLGPLGPWAPASTDLPAGGPRRVWRGPRHEAWLVSPGRWEAERRGLERLGSHPMRPRTAPGPKGVVLLEAYGEPLPEVAELLVAVGGAPMRDARPRGELLGQLGLEPRVARALGRCGVKRKHVDRFLSERVEVETRRGPSFGGLAPGWFRAQADHPAGLRCDRATVDGWLALELAGLALDAEPGGGLEALRDVHRIAVGDQGAADVAFDLARLAVLLREATVGRDEGAAARVVELVGASRGEEPPRARVWIEGPAFLDPALWEAPGAEVPAPRARWLLAHLDGLAVGDGRLSVRTDPVIRRGRRPPTREPQVERRRRLFSRWDRGIEVDDEGLFSATPEALAMRVAQGARGVVLDATCGVGSLAIAYARQPGVERVIAVDLDPGRLAMARHNARVYEVDDRIEWLEADAREAVRRVRADLLVIDPPWGGRGYDRDRVGVDDLGMDVAALLDAFAGPVVLKLPRSFALSTLPGRWEATAMVDERGGLKFLIARRA